MTDCYNADALPSTPNIVFEMIYSNHAFLKLESIRNVNLLRPFEPSTLFLIFFRLCSHIRTETTIPIVHFRLDTRD